MPAPAVSIVMPLYNAGPFLSEAIDSILQQHFTDFEFIILNDGSTDNSESIIHRYRDERIRYLRNDQNRGLAYTLNRGLREAAAPLIARMDADDISLPERLQVQYEYMEQHPEADLVAAVVELMDADGKPMGYWKEDHEHTEPADIQSFLAENNCIAHPTVMARKDIMLSLGYQEEQGEAEDYDLWLRWVSAGYSIHKINQVLLRHRILPKSFTRQRQRNVFFKLAGVKARFIWNEVSHHRYNDFMLMTGLMALADLARGTGKAVKKILQAS
ncbi:MAG: glycosyltransferase [Chitinophagaceae bacterium]|nr:glycosyltransferase [Chitinophagaceae bacterium]